MSSEYEKVHFGKWQDLAKAVIDGREFFVKNNVGHYFRLSFDGQCFNCKLKQGVENVYIKKQPTLEELIAIKPRLCWCVYSGKKYLKLIVKCDENEFISDNHIGYDNAQMLTNDEIKQLLNGE